MQYTLIKQINPQHAHIRFTGLLNGQKVTWDTQFFTIKEYARTTGTDTDRQQIIDIQPSESDIFKLTVVLNITKISHPDIQKMVIMIRQYKNLAIGRHQYG